MSKLFLIFLNWLKTQKNFDKIPYTFFLAKNQKKKDQSILICYKTHFQIFLETNLSQKETYRISEKYK